MKTSTIAEAAAILTGGRIVDLSKKVLPGGAQGPPGAPARRYQIEQFIYPPGEIMNYIAMESHISTHVEAPSHFLPALHKRPGDDVSEVPLERFFGMAVLVNCKDMAAGDQIGPETLKTFPIEVGDILVVGNSPWKSTQRPWLNIEGIDYLVDDRKIKMIGLDDTVYVERPEVSGKNLAGYYLHDKTLSKGIPVIEQMAHLNNLSKARFFFMGFPAAMGGLESFPIRAVAIEQGG
ncbi:MAG: cyclase family protein [Proteobacteria bacterium]|nr:cyclase family protein [Pseudomonadota bacterium]